MERVAPAHDDGMREPDLVREIIDRLGLRPHPEGGWYVETWRASAVDAAGRPVASAILFLLRAGERSHWHRVDAAELWQWSAGEPIELSLAEPGSAQVTRHRLGPDVLAGEQPQVVIPPGWWQAARPLGGWGLVGCVVAPAFTFEGFELAAEGWAPGGSAGREGGGDRADQGKRQ